MQPSATTDESIAAPAAGLMRLAWRLAGPTDAEDLVQATYLRVLEHGGAARSRPAWLRAVLRNEQWMTLRARHRRDAREHDAGLEVEPAQEVDEIVHCLALVRLVQQLVDALDDEVKLVVRERYFEGRTCAEIARTHCIPAGTVRWRLKIGLDRLRADLDAHHGGDRLLWAGTLIPPTLGPAAASTPTHAGAESVAAAKGSSVMSMIGMKLVVGALMLGAVGVTATAIGTRDDAPVVESPEVATAKSSEVASVETPRAPSSRGAVTHDERKAAAWASRLAKIQAAHATRTPAEPATKAKLVGGPADAEVRMCGGEECNTSMVEEILAMVDGCGELMGAAPPRASIEAKIIGAPDIGIVVESVEFAGGAEIPAELRECLTESMYALDLGATDQDLTQTVTLVLGDTADEVDMFPGVFFDADSRARIEEAIAQTGGAGKSGEIRMIMVSHPDTPAP